MKEQVPKVAAALVARSPSRWWDGAGLTNLFHRLGVNMRHAGRVWSQLEEWCSQSGETGHEDGKAQKYESRRGGIEYESARRAVVQEMFVRSAKNILRRDLRGAMEMGAGPHEIEKIVSKSFTNLSPQVGVDSEAHLGRVWHGVEQRFGVVVGQEQQTSVDSIRAVQRVALAVGARLTQTCLNDLEKELVRSAEKGASAQGGRDDARDRGGFTFTVADIESMEARVKFLDVDNFAEGMLLRQQAQDEVRARWASSGAS